MPYQIKDLSDPKTQAVELEFPHIDFPLVEIEKLTGKEVFERLFSPELRENNGNIVHWQTSIGKNKQIVYSYQGEVGETDIRTLQVNLFRQILSHASRADLYQALAAGSFQSLPVPPQDILYSKKITGTGPLAYHLQNNDLLTIRNDQGKPVVLFDALGLAKCLLAPKFTLETSNPAAASFSSDGYNAEISFNEGDFLSYMSTLLNQGIFMHLKDERLYPVSFPHAQAIQALTMVNFIIDCSGSMGSSMSKLKKHLKTIMERLYKDMDPTATFIRLSPFNSIIFPAIELALTEKDTLIREIDKLSAADGTALYQAIVKSAEYALTKPTMNKVDIYITDGGELNSPPEYYPNTDNTDLLSQILRALQKDQNPPQSFSIEIGELTDAILQVIQQKTNGHRIQANNDLSSFDMIYNYAGQFVLSRCYLDFVQQTREFRLPVLEGQVILSEQSLNPQSSFSINGGPAMIAKKPGASLFITKATSNTAAVEEKETQEKLQFWVAELKQQQREIERIQQESFKQHQLQLKALQAVHQAEQQRQAEIQTQQQTAMEALVAQHKILVQQMDLMQQQMRTLLAQKEPLHTGHSASSPSTLTTAFTVASLMTSPALALQSQTGSQAACAASPNYLSPNPPSILNSFEQSRHSSMSQETNSAREAGEQSFDIHDLDGNTFETAEHNPSGCRIS